MTKEQLSYYLKTIGRILNVPIALSTEEGMEYFRPFSLTAEENEYGFIVSRLKVVFEHYPDRTAMYFLHPNMIMLGIVVERKTRRFVFLGPLVSPCTTDKDISDYLFECRLSEDTGRKMKDYMSANRHLTPEQFRCLILNVNAVLNGDLLSEHELASLYGSEPERERAFFKSDLEAEATQYEHRDTILVEEYNEKLNYCLSHGDMDGLSDLLNTLGEVPYKESTSPVWESCKLSRRSAFGAVFAAETIALRSGIPPADLERTKEYYLERIENAATPDEHRKLSVNALFDFTKLVKEYLSRKTENPTINRVINYIKTNINSKLSAEDIAEALHINTHYLFVKFREETGKTFTQFVNEMKVEKACYFLLFTDKPLIDIAMHLSFSSQSYFQTVFKKVMGMTPAQYREHNKRK